MGDENQDGDVLVTEEKNTRWRQVCNLFLILLTRTNFRSRTPFFAWILLSDTPSQLNFIARNDFCARLKKSFENTLYFCTAFYTKFVRVKICKNKVVRKHGENCSHI